MKASTNTPWRSYLPAPPLTLAVQALAGVLLPSATVFLLLLCNDRQVLGPWTNPRWLNALASVIIGVLIMLSLILVVTTLFPDLDGTLVAAVLGGATVVGLLIVRAVELRAARRHRTLVVLDRDTWRMPPLVFLERPVWSTTREVGMLVLRGYLIVAAVLLIVKVVQLAVGQPG